MSADVELFQITGKRSPIDPRVGLLSIVTVSAVMIGGKLTGVEFWLRICCCIIPFLGLLAIKKWKTAIIYGVFYAFAILMEGAAFNLTTGIANLIVMILGGVISRFLAPIAMGYMVMQSTTVAEFIAAMEKMHVPSIITIPLSVMFRFFPTIAEENKAILDAMKMRQIHGLESGIIKRMEYELVPIMMSTVRIADELSQAALTKGLSCETKRTHICDVGFRIRDFIAIILLLTILILYMVF